MAEESTSFQKLLFPYFPCLEALGEEPDQCRRVGRRARLGQVCLQLLGQAASSPYHVRRNKKRVILTLQHNWKEISLRMRLGELLIERELISVQLVDAGGWRKLK